MNRRITLDGIKITLLSNERLDLLPSFSLVYDNIRMITSQTRRHVTLCVIRLVPLRDLGAKVKNVCFKAIFCFELFPTLVRMIIVYIDLLKSIKGKRNI